MKMDNNQEAVVEQFHSSLTENFFQEWGSSIDVFDTYEIMEELRDGEFGPAYKVKPKEIGSRRSSVVRMYCLKTIQLNRISRSDLHQEDIKKEVAALKASIV